MSVLDGLGQLTDQAEFMLDREGAGAFVQEVIETDCFGVMPKDQCRPKFVISDRLDLDDCIVIELLTDLVFTPGCSADMLLLLYRVVGR